jgi:predicted O-methyltransferase YrrM
MSAELIEMNPMLYAYLDSVSNREPAVLTELRAETQAMPRGTMQVPPMQGQFLSVLVMALGAKRIVEVGTFTGYSALSMALALPKDGKIWTLDISEEWSSVGRKYWDKAGVADKIELRVAPAADSLEALRAEGLEGTIDLVFIDADKPGYPVYWEHALKLVRPRGLVIADNTLFQSMVPHEITEADMREKWKERPPEVIEELVTATKSFRKFNEMVHADERVDIAMVPVGDGMTFAVKR